MCLLAIVKMFAEELIDWVWSGATGMIWGCQPWHSGPSGDPMRAAKGGRVAGEPRLQARGSRDAGSSQLWRPHSPPRTGPRASDSGSQLPRSGAQRDPGSVGGPASSLLGTPGLLGSGPRGCRPSPRHTTANGVPAAPARARRALRPALATPRGPGRTLGGLAGRSAGGAPQESPRRGHAA